MGLDPKGRTGLLIPLERRSHRCRIDDYRNLRWQSRHLVSAEQRLDLVLRQMLPLWLAKCDSLVPGEPHAPRRPGVKREAIPCHLAAEPTQRHALCDIVLEKDRRWRWISSGARYSAILVTDVEVFCGSSPNDLITLTPSICRLVNEPAKGSASLDRAVGRDAVAGAFPLHFEIEALPECLQTLDANLA